MQPAPALLDWGRRREGTVGGIRHIAFGHSKSCTYGTASRVPTRLPWGGGGCRLGMTPSTTGVAPCPNISPGWPCSGPGGWVLLVGPLAALAENQGGVSRQLGSGAGCRPPLTTSSAAYQTPALLLGLGLCLTLSPDHPPLALGGPSGRWAAFHPLPPQP